MEDGFSSGLALGQATRNEGGMWDNGMGIFGIIALLAFAGGGFGNWGNRSNDSLVQNDALISNALQTTQLESSANQRQTCMDFANTNSNIVNGNYQTQNAIANGFSGVARDICQASTAIANDITSTREDIQNRLFSISQDMQNSFCGIQRGIDSINYNDAINTASINATTTAQTQKILDAIAQNKIEALQSKVNSLELSSALCGIPRTSPYGYAMTPLYNYYGCNGNTGYSI